MVFRMRVQIRGLVSVLWRSSLSVGIALSVAACGNASSSVGNVAGGPATGDARGSSSGSAALGGTNGGGVDSGGSAAVAACPEAPTRRQTTGTLVELTFAPVLGGKPLRVAEPTGLAEGIVTPTNIRFYLSELALLGDDGSRLAVDLVSAEGNAESYGVHLVNFDEPSSLTIRTLAPAGSYSGASFTWGISDACNASTGLRSPLSFDSQMTWPHLAGFLFFRYEAQWAAATNAPASSGPPPMIHMGGLVGSITAPTAQMNGAFTVPPSGSLARTVQMSFEQIFAGASSADDVSALPPFFQTPEVIAGERLRRGVPQLAVFTFER